MTGVELSERDLLERGITQLVDLLGDGWRLGLQQDETEPVDRGIDALLRVGRPGGQQVVMIVEAKSNLTPSDAARTVGPRLRARSPAARWWCRSARNLAMVESTDS